MIDKVCVHNLGGAISAVNKSYGRNGDATKVAEKLGATDIGSGHDCFLRGIIVTFDLTLPHYVLPQLQRYHFVEFVMSQSKMHSLKNFPVADMCVKEVDSRIISIVEDYQRQYEEDPTTENFRLLLANVPLGFRLTASLVTNYSQLKTIYYQRRSHRLSEWRTICNWIETLPMFGELILGGAKHEPTIQ